MVATTAAAAMAAAAMVAGAGNVVATAGGGPLDPAPYPIGGPIDSGRGCRGSPVLCAVLSHPQPPPLIYNMVVTLLTYLTELL